jgi:hypothetical protein
MRFLRGRRTSRSSSCWQMSERAPRCKVRSVHIMKRFKSQRHLQRFVSIHDPICQPVPHPTPQRHLQPSSRTARSSNRPVGENRSSMTDKIGRRHGLTPLPLSLRCRSKALSRAVAVVLWVVPNGRPGSKGSASCFPCFPCFPSYRNRDRKGRQIPLPSISEVIVDIPLESGVGGYPHLL